MAFSFAQELPLTAVDAPFNLHGAPSMQQSLQLGYAAERSAQSLQLRNLERPASLAAGWGVAVAMTPVWTQVSVAWSRSVLTVNDIDSSGIGHIDGVDDDELRRLKQQNPVDSARLQGAGMEARYAGVRFIGDELFHGGGPGRTVGPVYFSDSRMAPSMWLLELRNLKDFDDCIGSDADTLADALSIRDTHMLDRDFTGLACTAWVYEAMAPDAAYDDRGAHPYGEGVDRYLGWSDLSPVNQKVLRRARRLSLLGGINPHLFGVDRFVIGPHRFMGSATMIIAPWGCDVQVRLRYGFGDTSFLVDLHRGYAMLREFNGLRLGVRGVALPAELGLDLEVAGWMQPKDQRWDATQATPGGQVVATVRRPVHPRIDASLTLDGKTEGWVVGNPYTGSNVSVRLGGVVKL